VAEFAIRVPSIDDLLDPHSAEPVERRPLQEDVRERILLAWVDTRHEKPDHLTVEMPAQIQAPGVTEALESAIRADLEATYEESKHLHAFTPGQRREAGVAFTFLVICLLASSLIDKVTANHALFTAISQGLVVLGWVAMWQPAQQVFHAVSRRMSRKEYRQLSIVPIEIEWT
jgi:hypothetical protein